MILKASSLLGEEKRKQFQRYCRVAGGLFEETDIGEIADFFEEFKNVGSAVFDGRTTYAEIDPTERQVRAMHPHRHDSRVKNWFLLPNVASALEELLGKPALGVQTMYYFKPPGARGQGMHQDNFYLVSQPATCIAAWTAIDDADLENGCLWVVPGSQRGDILCPEAKTGKRWMEYGDSHISKFPRGRKPVPVPVRRGETMFFSGNLIHGSGPNRTKDRPRRTFIGHYIDEASEQVARFYHPMLNMRGEEVSGVAVYAGGGPCGSDWKGGLH